MERRERIFCRLTETAGGSALPSGFGTFLLFQELQRGLHHDALLLLLMGYRLGPVALRLPCTFLLNGGDALAQRSAAEQLKPRQAHAFSARAGGVC